ncbi:MAG: hypothetical protein IAG13_28125 [Deltaproteobacteria bacterium]|nr:hypothetical protein [Nannocystaceae bacterium]
MTSRLVPAALAVSLCSIAVPAAAQRTLFGKPVADRVPLSEQEIAKRRAAFQQHLRDGDLVLDGDHLVRGSALRGEVRPQRAFEDPPHYATIFLNFFGGELSSGTNAAEMEAGCVGAGPPIQYPAYAGTEALALTMIQVFQNAMEPYAVRIAYEDPPPAHLPYSMVMMGGDPVDLGMDSGILGVSCSSDCGDVWWRDSTFAFTEASSSALTLGNTALQEAAHAFGLDHIDGSEHIMYPFGTSGAKIWATECTPYNDATGGISCTYIHDEFCGEDSGMQNDDAELLAYFGPNAPDVDAPVVVINEPADGLEVASGTMISVKADVTDDHEGAGWRLRVVPEQGDELIQNAYDFATSWSFAVPDGTYEIYVEAIDHDLNEGSDMVTVYVGSGAPVDTSGDDGGSDGAGSTGVDDGSGDDEGDDGSTGVDQDDDDTTQGCACGITAPRVSTLALLVLVPLSRRRRRA